QRGAAGLNRLAAGGDAFVGRFLGVAGDHVKVLERQAEFLGRDLRQRRDNALAELDLAGAYGGAAVGRDANPRIEHAVAVEASRQDGRLLPGGKFWSERDGDNDAPEAGGKIPPRDVRVHHILPIAWLALSTARMMRPWVPQRHRLPASASRTCTSVGRRF